jgi:TPR repeat protein
MRIVASALVCGIAQAVLLAQQPGVNLTVLDLATVTQQANAGSVAAQDELGRRFINAAAWGHATPQDYAQAVYWYGKAAYSGDPAAEYYLGLCYEYGLGVDQSWQQAASWFAKSADGSFNLAYGRAIPIYYLGIGVPVDINRATAWYNKVPGLRSPIQKYIDWAAGGGLSSGLTTEDRYSDGMGILAFNLIDLDTLQQRANTGEQAAEAELGMRYLLGVAGAGQDYVTGIKWLQKAAQQYNSTAWTGLGWAYETGTGVPLNYSQALYWYTRAAAVGDPVAANNIGYMYQYGVGVAADASQAQIWQQRSASLGGLANLRFAIASVNPPAVPAPQPAYIPQPAQSAPTNPAAGVTVSAYATSGTYGSGWYESSVWVQYQNNNNYTVRVASVTSFNCDTKLINLPPDYETLYPNSSSKQWLDTCFAVPTNRPPSNGQSTNIRVRLLSVTAQQ